MPGRTLYCASLDAIQKTRPSLQCSLLPHPRRPAPVPWNMEPARAPTRLTKAAFRAANISSSPSTGNSANGLAVGEIERESRAGGNLPECCLGGNDEFMVDLQDLIADGGRRCVQGKCDLLVIHAGGK